MKIKWTVEDGYVTGDRPHYLEIPNEEFVGLSDDQKEELINEWVQETFEQEISWSWKIINE